MNGYDIAVIGAGPAGSAAAITAGRLGAKVLLLERDTFPRPRVCGEFVSSEAVALLGRLLGEAHPLLTSSLQISCGRLFLGRRTVELAIRPAARSIPRFDLDFALWEAAVDARVEARAQETVQSVLGDGPFEIRTTRSTFRARAVINASGRWSGVLRAPRPPVGPKWIGIKAHYSASNAADSVDLYFFPHGYCGVQPVRAGVVNVCALVRSDVATDLAQVFMQHPALAAISRGWQPQTEPQNTAPLIHAPPAPVESSILQAGDAAAFIDPFLGDGISLALHTGTSAAQAASRLMHGAMTLESATRLYAADYARRFTPAFRHAGRLRRLLSLASPLQPALAAILSTPFLAAWLLARTRPRPASG